MIWTILCLPMCRYTDTFMHLINPISTHRSYVPSILEKMIRRSIIHVAYSTLTDFVDSEIFTKIFNKFKQFYVFRIRKYIQVSKWIFSTKNLPIQQCGIRNRWNLSTFKVIWVTITLCGLRRLFVKIKFLFDLWPDTGALTPWNCCTALITKF